MAGTSQVEVMISLLCERRAPLTEFISDLEKTKNYLAVLLGASYAKAIAVLTKECILFLQKSRKSMQMKG